VKLFLNVCAIINIAALTNETRSDCLLLPSFADRVLSRYAKETLPVIAITGSEDPAGTDTSSVTHITTGFNEVGVKPTDNEHMQRLLQSHLRCLADPVSGVIDLGSTW
jgi:hypothetical protein